MFNFCENKTPFFESFDAPDYRNVTKYFCRYLEDMNQNMFTTLFQLIERNLQPISDNNRPDAIPAEHRLALTLEQVQFS